MILYIANATAQMQTIVFRMIEGRKGPGAPTQSIGMARQERVAGDLNLPQIEFIVEQLRVYGLHALDELDAARETYVPLVYSVDKPVPHDIWKALIERNKELMKRMGSKLRRDAAIATSHGMRPFSPQAADGVSLSVEEEKTGSMDHGGDQPLAEGYRMNTLMER